MRVIGIAGQAQMGKDTVADQLQLSLNEGVKLTLGNRDKFWHRSAFAYAVKKIYCDTFGVDLDFVEKWKTNPLPPPGFDMPVRQSLQFIGDGFRTIKSSIWLDLAFRDVSVPTVFSDVRYMNELLRVKDEGGVAILVGRPDKLNDDPNGSEAQIRPYVAWCLNHFKDHDEKVIQLNKMDWESIRRFSRNNLGFPMPPDNIERIDLFVMNNGTVEDIKQLVNDPIATYCQKFEYTN